MRCPQRIGGYMSGASRVTQHCAQPFRLAPNRGDTARWALDPVQTVSFAISRYTAPGCSQGIIRE